MIVKKEAEKRKMSSIGEKYEVGFGVSPVKIWPSPVMKMDIDCFYELFEYLALDELISIGNTCKRLQLIAGSFIQQNYAAKRKTCGKEEIFISWIPRRIGAFSRFIEKLSVFGNYNKSFLIDGSNKFKCLKELRLAQVELNPQEIQCIKEILVNVEILELEQCQLNEEFYDNFLQYCSKVKRLSVSRSTFDRDRATIIGSGNDWLFRKYPTIEHLELTDLYEFQNKELKTIFAQNPNIRSFSTDAKSLFNNRDSFLICGAKLEKFTVEFQDPKNISLELEPVVTVNLIFNLLRDLHEQGFYNRMHLYINFVDYYDCAQKIFSLKPIEMLSGFIVRIDNPLMKLKELDINKGSDVIDLDQFPNIFPDLERIHFSQATADHILPFICSLKKLNIMKIDCLLDGNHLKGGALNLIALNKERKKLFKPRKVVIYVDERVFLATKWATMELNLDSIELRKGESFELDETNSRYKFIKSF